MTFFRIPELLPIAADAFADRQKEAAPEPKLRGRSQHLYAEDAD
jgi:hypothetical protein